MTPAQFIAKWSPVTLSERAASQEHFIDLARLLGQPTPAEHDATGAEYTFDKGVSVTAPASKGSKGESGFADVWWRRKFGWEYKRKDKHKDLVEAYRQLCQYREDLENPPLLIVSDITTTEIHTNFTGTKPEVHTIKLDELDTPANLDLLRRVFTDPESFRPGQTRETVTKEVAEQVGKLAVALGQRGHDPHDAAHFLMKCMFCLFAEDAKLLPDNLFSRLLAKWRKEPEQLTALLTDLFAKMAKGGPFGMESIPYFNGGLFDDNSPALPLTEAEITMLSSAAGQDWTAVEPAIFGTLFERSLDPSKRAQIGAHYTSREDIMLIIEPVMMTPLRREWADVQTAMEKQIARRRKATTPQTKKKADADISKALNDFMQRLEAVRILDPACGSGNFLYVAIQELLSLEKEVIRYASRAEIGLGLLPTVRPTQLHGIEINPYAAELAQVVIWIGYLQWMQENGFNVPRDPILEPLQTIKNGDAILDLSDPDNPKPSEWPQADFIVGNPPFLGGNRIRQGLGDEYVESLFKVYEIPNFSDLCCYWFERARMAIENPARWGGRGRGSGWRGQDRRGGGGIPNGPDYLRVGLLATQAIRGATNRTVLQKIKGTGDIFMAWSDRDWVLEGAAVHVSIVGFDGAKEEQRVLNGQPVSTIHADLTAETDLTAARRLSENLGIQHEGDKKGGPFDVPYPVAREMLASPTVSTKPMSECCRPWFNGLDVLRRDRGMWIIDFKPGLALEEAAQFDMAFEYVRQHVASRYEGKRKNWWIHERFRPEMRQALDKISRLLVTTRDAQHQVFVWRDTQALPDSAVIGFARQDDYWLVILQSTVHVLWALRKGTQLETRPRYTPSSCFETFPLPWPPGTEPIPDPLHERISAAAEALNEQRERWLNPPEWIEPIAAQVDATDDFSNVPADARPLIRQSAIMARAANDPNLKKRTLTNLYNQRPTWLKLAHLELDRAVLATYATVDPDGDWSEDWAEVWEETGAGQPLSEDHPLAERRREVGQAVLENLLRMNLARASASD